jgi:hypothetical protein
MSDKIENNQSEKVESGNKKDTIDKIVKLIPPLAQAEPIDKGRSWRERLIIKRSKEIIYIQKMINRRTIFYTHRSCQ